MTSEDLFRAEWLKHEIYKLPPYEMAAMGGEIATDQATLFIAGYQAAIRQCFIAPESLQTERQWSSYAASEGSPVLAVENFETQSVTLSGEKTWIAAIEHVENLIVQIRDNGQVRHYFVPVSTKGLALVTNPTPKMLPELSQGRAHLDDIVIPLRQRLDGDEAKAFPLAEATMFLLALSANITQQASSSEIRSRALMTMDNITEHFPITPKRLLECYSDIQSLKLHPDNGSFVECNDLLTLYIGGLKKHLR